MKYTRDEIGEVIEVKGCQTCPHKENVTKDGETFMQCRAPLLRPDSTYKPCKKKLIGRWTGPYHASCPLASDPANVPIPEVKK